MVFQLFFSISCKIEDRTQKQRRLARCINGWESLNEHFTGIWNCTTSNNELIGRTFQGKIYGYSENMLILSV